MVPAIRCRALHKRYGSVVAVDGLDLDVADGEVFGLLGRNGAGKTTTLEMCEGLRRPDSGEIEVLGRPVWPDPRPIRGLIGVQLQSTALFDHLTALETVRLFGRLYERGFTTARAHELLGLVGLADRAAATARQLSGGQQQRLSIAVALVHEPRLLFLDEPTTGLDPAARRDLWDVVRDTRAAGRTVVLTTHYMEEAAALCDRIAVIDGGRIVATGSPDQLVRAHGGEAVVAFDAGGLDPDAVAALPGVSAVRAANGRVVVSAVDPAALVGAVLARGGTVPNLSVQPATLEDAFLNLTGPPA